MTNGYTIDFTHLIPCKQCFATEFFFPFDVLPKALIPKSNLSRQSLPRMIKWRSLWDFNFDAVFGPREMSVFKSQ